MTSKDKVISTLQERDFTLGQCLASSNSIYLCINTNLFNVIEDTLHYGKDAFARGHHFSLCLFRILEGCPRRVSCARRCRWRSARPGVSCLCRRRRRRRGRGRRAAGWWARPTAATARLAALTRAASYRASTPPPPPPCPSRLPLPERLLLPLYLASPQPADRPCILILLIGNIFDILEEDISIVNL